jgi:aminomuconate-semialdehyde/2-hydroxymuconate-6-semialdehyde dehydrogenase
LAAGIFFWQKIVSSFRTESRTPSTYMSSANFFSDSNAKDAGAAGAVSQVKVDAPAFIASVLSRSTTRDTKRQKTQKGGGKAASTLLMNFIGGEFVAPKSGNYMDDVNPATGVVEAKLPRSNSTDVDDAVKAATDTFHSGVWSKMAPGARADILDRIADGLKARKQELAMLESIDTGKPFFLCKIVDITRAEENFRYFSGLLRQDLLPCHMMPDALNYSHRTPIGVCGLITPWNLPLYLLSWKVAPCLACGNTCVVKPSELTPLTATALAEVCQDAGLPAGVYNLVHGTGFEAGAAITESPLVRLVSFTGGTVTGRKVASVAASSFKKLSLELGGKNPSIVFADCDFEKAVEGVVRAGFLNNGQICLCGSRILVQRPIYEKFRDAFVAKVKLIQLGDPLDDKTRAGSLISAGHLQKVQSYVALAKQEGGTLLTGDEPVPVAHVGNADNHPHLKPHPDLTAVLPARVNGRQLLPAQSLPPLSFVPSFALIWP